VDIAWPDLSLVYATPLLQHQAQFGLNAALLIIARAVSRGATSDNYAIATAETRSRVHLLEWTLLLGVE